MPEWQKNDEATGQRGLSLSQRPGQAGALVTLCLCLAAAMPGCSGDESKDSSGSSAAAGQTVVVNGERAEFDFGYVEPEATRTVSFIIRNSSADEMGIVKVFSDCPCISLPAAPSAVPPRGEAVVRVQYQSSEKREHYSGQAVVMTDKASRLRIILGIKATVGLPLRIEGDELHAGTLAPGQRRELTAILTNLGRSPVRPISGRSSSASCSVQVPQVSIPGGGRLKLPISITAESEPGERSASVQVETDCPYQRLVKFRVRYVVSAGEISQVPEKTGAKAESPVSNTQPNSLGALRVVLFNSRTCARGCKKVDEAMSEFAREWGNRVVVETYYVDSDDPEPLYLFVLYDRHYGLGVQSTPTVYVGARCMVGSDDILAGLGDAVAGELAAGTSTYQPSQEEIAAFVSGRDHGGRELLDRISVGGVIGAGLIDGINPCAFTTAVFLISMLTYLGKNRRQIAAVGAAFTSSVFATYFLLGLGLLGAIKVFSVQRGIATGLTWAVGLLALGLGVWSLVDFIRYVRTGDTAAMTLGLPLKIKQRIHKVIREGLRTPRLVAGAFAVGATVAVLESLCTGQVYLPTIMLVMRRPGLAPDALGYLLLYNVMFILPLVAVVIAAYAGAGSQRLGELLRSNLAVIKLLLALLFLSLGAMVLLTA